MRASAPEAPPQARARSGRRRLIVAAAVLLPAAAVLALLAYGFTTEPKYIPTPLIAKPAPPFSLPRFDGGVLRLEELRGKVVFLNFWEIGRAHV